MDDLSNAHLSTSIREESKNDSCNGFARFEQAFAGFKRVRRTLGESPQEAPIENAQERMYEPGETQFGIYAPGMVALGWSVFPQEKSGRRGPGMVDGIALKWKPYQTQLPTSAEIKSWAAQCPSHNVAIITGQASGYIFAVDIDIDDHATSQRVQDIARDVLGLTPFRRVGADPRIILVYRHAPDVVIPSRSVKVGEAGHAIEVLAAGKPFTAFGVHHKLGRYIQWLDTITPACHGPEHAPLVTPEKLEDFFEAVGREFELSKSGSRSQAAAPAGMAVRVGDLNAPRSARYKGVADDPTTGKPIGNDRDPWVLARTRDWALFNPRRSYEQLVDAAIDDCRQHITLDGKWTESHLQAKVRSNLRGACDKRDAGEKFFTPYRASAGEDGVLYAPAPSTMDAADDADMKLLARSHNRAKLRFVPGPVDRVKAAQRALIKEKRRREPITDLVAADVCGTIQAFLDMLWDAVLSKNPAALEGLQKIWLMIAPTGAGKTSTLVRLFAQQVLRRGRLGRPVALMLPSYSNIDEVDDRRKAMEQALEAQRTADALVAVADGIRCMVYKGMIAAGCRMAEHAKKLQDAGVGTSGMCESRTEKDEETGEPVRCVHYYECPAQLQKKMVEDQDLILLPTAFLDTNIAAQLKKHVAALFIDERCWTNLVHQKCFPLVEGLKADRREPYFTAKEREMSEKTGTPLPDPEQLKEDRRELNDLIIRALRDRIDVAAAVLDYRRRGAAGCIVTGESLMDSSDTVLARTSTARHRVKPNLSAHEYGAIVADEKDLHLWSEKRLLKVIRERMDWLKEDRLAASLPPIAGCAPYVQKARGETDRRIALLTHGEKEMLRVSWRTEANFRHLPCLMLDASAAPEIIEKLWAGREVDTIRIEAPLHLRVLAVMDRTYSNFSLLPGKQESAFAAVETAERQLKVKSVINAAGVLFGHSRVLVGSTRTIKEDLNNSWAHLPNVDWLHFGHTRGFDFAKHHACALSIGRLEMPPAFIDGVVAALTYDDPDPEEPIDALGTGLDAEGNSIRPPMATRTIPMRDGSDTVIQVPEWKGGWARLVQKQFREEELLQFIGRLRPVYAEGEAPLAIMMSSVIPENLIVDDIVALDDMTANTKVWDAVRRAGILDERLTPRMAADLDPLFEVVRAMRPILEEGMATRSARGFDRYEFFIEGEDKPRTVLIGRWVENPARAIFDAVDEHRRQYVDRRKGVRLVEMGYEGPSLATPRAPDEKLIDVVGTLEQRRHAEWKLREATITEVAVKCEFKFGSRVVRPGPPEVADMWTSIAARMLLKRAGDF